MNPFKIFSRQEHVPFDADATNPGLDLSPAKLLILFIPFILFYTAFIIFSGSIHGAGADISRSDITPWMLLNLQQSDGIEVHVMAFAMPLYLLLGYWATNCMNSKLRLPENRQITNLYFCLILGVCVMRYWFGEPHVGIGSGTILFLSTMVLCGAIIYFSEFSLPPWAKKMTPLVLFPALVLMLLLMNTSLEPDIEDYNFFCASANKLLAGEKLGTFYKQYEVVSVYLVALMQKCNLQMHEMYIIFNCIFAFWILLYAKLASLLFKKKTFVYLFMLVLITVRCMAIGGPGLALTLNPLRLELWVPLLIVIAYCGLYSYCTSIAVAVCYLANDVFGFMYLALYGTILAVDVLRNSKEGDPVHKALLWAAPALAVIIHLLIFGTISSPAGQILSKFNIGFAPISTYSLFWIITWILPICLYVLLQNEKRKQIVPFLFGVSCAQSVYFFGRSYDHDNLLVISGIFVLILFFAIDHVYSFVQRKKAFLWAVTLLICGVTVYFGSFITAKWSWASYKIHNRLIVRPLPVEQMIPVWNAYLKKIDPNEILLLSNTDSYIIYRLGYRQMGYFAPFSTNIYADKTADFLVRSLEQGSRAIVFPGTWDISQMLLSLNNYPAMAVNKKKFVLIPLDLNLMEMKIFEYSGQTQ